MLAGCGLAESRSPVPEFMRSKAPEPPPLEAPPEVRQLVRENLNSLFSSASKPRHVRVSQPYREVRGPGWTACVRADLLNVIGKPTSMTYRIIINRGMITDRRRAEPDDTCASENYEPI